MRACAICKKQVTIDKYFSRKSKCPHCGEDLHMCLNCKSYYDAGHGQCLDERAEPQRTRNKANFCDYFSFKKTAHRTADKGKEDAKKNLRIYSKSPSELLKPDCQNS